MSSYIVRARSSTSDQNIETIFQVFSLELIICRKRPSAYRNECDYCDWVRVDKTFNQRNALRTQHNAATTLAGLLRTCVMIVSSNIRRRQSKTRYADGAVLI